MNHVRTIGRLISASQGFRFVAVGVLNTVFGYSIFVLGLLLRLSPVVALFVATATGAIFNYFTTARFAFSYRALNRLPLFVAAYAVIYCVDAVALRLLLHVGLSPALAQALLVPMMAALSFLLFRTFVFKAARLG